MAAALLIVGAIGAGGCGDDSPTGPEPETPDDEAAPSRFGTWEVTDGELRVEPDPDLLVRAMRLDEDGTARLYFADERIGGVRSVATGTHIGTVPLIIQLPTVTPGDPTFPGLDVALEGDVLTLTESGGRAVTLERRADLPPGIAPALLPVVERFDDLPAPDPLTDLAADGNLLVYNSATAVEAFDPSTGTMTTAVTQRTDMIVMSRPRRLTNGAAHRFWVLDRSKPLELWHRTLGDGLIQLVYDSVVMDAVDSRLTRIDAVAYQELPLGVTGSLFVHGMRTSSHTMISVNITKDPPEVGDFDPFDRPVHAMDYDNAGLWVIAGSAAPVIAVLNSNTMAVRESYAVPDENVTWHGLYLTDARVHLLGTDPATGNGVIVLLEHP